MITDKAEKQESRMNILDDNDTSTVKNTTAGCLPGVCCGGKG